MARAIDHSLSVGLYALDGFRRPGTRAWSPTAARLFAWLCDVFVDAAHRQHGLGSFLFAHTVGHPDVASIRQVLMAEPGRTIYRRFGFEDLPSAAERWTWNAQAAEAGHAWGQGSLASDRGVRGGFAVVGDRGHRAYRRRSCRLMTGPSPGK